MAPRTPESRLNRAKTRAVAVRRDERLVKMAGAIVSGLGLLALLLLLTNP
jgi:hypothetical protein